MVSSNSPKKPSCFSAKLNFNKKNLWKQVLKVFFCFVLFNFWPWREIWIFLLFIADCRFFFQSKFWKRTQLWILQSTLNNVKYVVVIIRNVGCILLHYSFLFLLNELITRPHVNYLHKIIMHIFPKGYVPTNVTYMLLIKLN